jgi:hypothetical protein
VTAAGPTNGRVTLDAAQRVGATASVGKAKVSVEGEARLSHDGLVGDVTATAGVGRVAAGASGNGAAVLGGAVGVVEVEAQLDVGNIVEGFAASVRESVAEVRRAVEEATRFMSGTSGAP